jgi:hypothetical protein
MGKGHISSGSKRVRPHLSGELADTASRSIGRVVYRGHSFRKKIGGQLRNVAPGAANPPAESVPIWFSALLATPCRAKGDGSGHLVRWNCVSGRALYTNDGAKTQQIEPLGVSLQSGQTLAVSWTPGDTAYTLEVIRSWTT